MLLPILSIHYTVDNKIIQCDNVTASFARILNYFTESKATDIDGSNVIARIVYTLLYLKHHNAL